MESEFGIESRLWVSFSVMHFNCDPDEISKVLGVKPSRLLRKGESMPGGRSVQKFNLWSWKSGVAEFRLEKLISSVLKVLKNANKLKTKIGKHKASLNIILEVVGSDNRPSIYLTSKQIGALAKLGVPLSVDYYFFVKSQRSDSRRRKGH